jgi:hypothetical protein
MRNEEREFESAPAPSQSAPQGPFLLTFLGMLRE